MTFLCVLKFLNFDNSFNSYFNYLTLFSWVFEHFTELGPNSDVLSDTYTYFAHQNYEYLQPEIMNVSREVSKKNHMLRTKPNKILHCHFAQNLVC